MRIVLRFEPIYVEYENYAFNHQAMLCFGLLLYLFLCVTYEQQFYAQGLVQCLAHNSA